MSADYNLHTEYTDPTDQISVRRGDLIKLVRAAQRATAYSRFGLDGTATGVGQFLHDELQLLSERPPICACCHADGDMEGLCSAHFDQATEQRRDDVMAAAELL